MKYPRKPNSYVYLDTPCGKIRGLRRDGHLLFAGIQFANAGRWEDPVVVEHWDGVYDATRFGPLCSQQLAFHEGYGPNDTAAFTMSKTR